MVEPIPATSPPPGPPSPDAANELVTLREALDGDTFPEATPQRAEALSRYKELLDQQAPPPATTAPPAVPLPEALQADPVASELATQFSASATELGIPAPEITSLLMYRPAPEASIHALEAALGADAQAILDAAAAALERFPKSVQAHAHRTGLSFDPTIVRRLAALGKPMVEAEKKLQAMQLDPAHPVNRPWDVAEHTKAREELRRLQRIVYGIDAPGHVRR